MILSRLFYFVMALALSATVALLYLATASANRRTTRTAQQLLTSGASAVNWYLRDDSRERAAVLVLLAVDDTVKTSLKEASNTEAYKDLKADARQKVKQKLATFRQTRTADFDALWAVDVHGRVIAAENFERGTGSEHFEMGGYPVVADALHGWIRDDAWVLDNQIFRVVAHPVEIEVGGAPVGCIIGAKIIDGAFAQALSERTDTAVAFYANGTRVASGAPADFDKAMLEINTGDLDKLKDDTNYQDKGKTEPMILRTNPNDDVMVVFSRLTGEAWDLGAGYVVGYRQTKVRSPFEYATNDTLADEKDKSSVPIWLLVAVVVGGLFIGLIFSIFEHTVPLSRFRRAVSDLASKKSDTDVLKPSTFRGTFKKIAGDINDALDKVASKAGIERGPADLESVLGPLPAQPQMSAFAVPKSDARPSTEGLKPGSSPGMAAAPQKPLPQPRRSLPKRQEDEISSSGSSSGALMRSAIIDDDEPVPPPQSGRDGLPDAAMFGAALRGDAPGAPIGGGRDEDDDNQPTRVAPVPDNLAASMSASMASVGDDEDDDGGLPVDEETEWRKVYADFISMKKKLGEATDKLTYEKFRGTLQRNKEALMSRHHCQRVKFKVYEKQGRAALKASPVK